MPFEPYVLDEGIDSQAREAKWARVPAGDYLMRVAGLEFSEKDEPYYRFVLEAVEGPAPTGSRLPYFIWMKSKSDGKGSSQFHLGNLLTSAGPRQNADGTTDEGIPETYRDAVRGMPVNSFADHQALGEHMLGVLKDRLVHALVADESSGGNTYSNVVQVTPPQTFQPGGATVAATNGAPALSANEVGAAAAGELTSLLQAQLSKIPNI